MTAPEPPRSTGSNLESALPSVGARVLAFVAVLLGGACGGLIGWSLAGLQCTGNCALARGLGGLIGAVVAALGTAVLAVLVLRAMTEWRSLPNGALPRRYTR
jgi:hypothetical protein